MAVEMITSIHNYIGVAADVATLPTTDILTGSKFTALDSGARYIFDGTNWIPDLTDVVVTPQTLDPASNVVAQGFYAATTLDAVDADLAVGNIKTGVVIFGITGTYDTEAVNPITAGVIQTGKIGFVNGSKITGNGTKTLSAANDTVDAGYYAATTLHAVDSDLATANIKAGVTIFGVVGKTEVVDTTEAGSPATAGDIKSGMIAFVNGVKITGTLP